MPACHGQHTDWAPVVTRQGRRFAALTLLVGEGDFRPNGRVARICLLATQIMRSDFNIQVVDIMGPSISKAKPLTVTWKFQETFISKVREGN